MNKVEKVMNRLREKLEWPIKLIFILAIGASSVVHGQESESLSDFRFTVVESSKDGIKLKCQKGCAWETLSFTTEDAQAVNQFGMTNVNGEEPKKQTNLANFLFTIENTTEGVELRGLQGTAWTQLTFGMKKGQSQSVDEIGMTSSE